jgi:hypothetical protein
MPALRNPFAGSLATVTVAPKSLFIVFRVPLMNLVLGLAAAVMLSQSPDFADPVRRSSYSRAFASLLFAAALKSDFEALEIGLLAHRPQWDLLGPWFTAGTAPPELHLNLRSKAVLAALSVFCAAMLIASLRAAHRP